MEKIEKITIKLDKFDKKKLDELCKYYENCNYEELLKVLITDEFAMIEKFEKPKNF